MPDKNLTDTEIIKIKAGLESEIKRAEYTDTDYLDCVEVKDFKLALDLINRLEAKNSNLTSDLTSLQNDLTSAKAEIEKWQKNCDELYEQMSERQKAEVEIAKRMTKAEAYKEFANRLTDKIMDNIDRGLDNPNGNDYVITDVYETIDNLLNELVGDGSEGGTA